MSWIVWGVLHFVAAGSLASHMREHHNQLWVSYGSPSLENSKAILGLYQYVFTGRFSNENCLKIKLWSLALLATSIGLVIAAII